MEQIEIGRNGRLSTVLAGVATVLALAFLIRGNGTVDVVIGALLAVLAIAQAYAAWDAKVPLLIADTLGVRLRLGRVWAGLPWSELDEVEHLPRSGWLRDGKLVLLARDEEQIRDSLSPQGQRQADWTERLYGAPFVLPLGLTTRVQGVQGSLSSQLADLSRGATTIIEIDPSAEDSAAADAVAFPGSASQRDSSAATSSGSSTSSTSSSSTPSAIEDTAERPAFTFASLTTVAEPVVGPRLKAARENIGLSIDQLSERTRIRPRVLESIERDDFAACGGDFYARGHLRTLARVLGLDAHPLLASYDQHYADAPVDPRRAFEPELAGLTGSTGGALRKTKTGPNWSVLVAAVMSVVLLWSIARLVFDGTSSAPEPAIGLSSGSSGSTNPYGKLKDAVPVVLTAAGGGAEVVVRDAGGSVVFSGDLAFGASRTLKASPPVRVQSSDGSLTVSLGGAKAKAVGETGVAAQRIYAGTHE